MILGLLAIALWASAPVFAESALEPRQVAPVVDTLGNINRDGSPISPPEPECPPGAPGCSEQFEAFCKKLYGKSNPGNLDLKVGASTVPIRLGSTDNQLSESLAALIKAKIDAQERLPPELVTKLKAKHYFKLLDLYLHSKPRSQLTIAQGIAIDQIGSELGLTWEGAIQELSLERVELKHPGYHKKKSVPSSWKKDYDQIESQLRASIYVALWEKNPRWQQMQADFEEVRGELMKEIVENPSLTSQERNDWSLRVATVKLEIPGSDPRRAEDGCATTMKNAFYRPQTHTLTLCAGYFNGTELKEVMAHELSHSVGIMRARFEHNRESAMGKRLVALREAVCGARPASCPDSFKDFLANYATDLPSLGKVEAQTPAFRECLQYHKIDTQPSVDEVRAAAVREARSDIATYADKSLLLKMVIPEETLATGGKVPSPSYLNPCGLRWVRPELMSAGDEGDILFFESAAYACDSSTADKPERLKHAIDVALRIHQDILERTTTQFGKFSDNDFMLSGGYAEDTEERFADGLGNRVFTRLVKKQPESAREAFVQANLAQRCAAPDEIENHPDEAQVVKTYSFEPHSTGKQRRLEVLVPELRQALGCKKDFNIKDCRL